MIYVSFGPGVPCAHDLFSPVPLSPAGHREPLLFFFDSAQAGLPP